MSEARLLAAIVYEAGHGAEADRLLGGLADRLQAAGFSLAGTTQFALERADRCACDMIVRDLATNQECRISEDRGPHARGCRLDADKLSQLVGSTAAALARGVDVLIVNKFGKQEVLGAGFRDVIATALGSEVPTLVAVNATHIEGWRQFAGDFADHLAPDAGLVHGWLESRLPRQRKVLMADEGTALSLEI